MGARTVVLLVCAALALGLGLLFTARGLWALVQGHGTKRALPPLAVGLLSIALLGWAGWHLRHALAPLLLNDFMADAERLDELQKANLDPWWQRPGTAVDWPQWRGPYRDGVSAETGLLTDWPEGGPRIVWRRPIHGGYSSVAVARDCLYTQDRDGGDERVLCLDAATGRELWVHRHSVDYSSVKYGEGPRATPTVHDGRVYTVGATGVFLCLESRPDGGQPRLLWQHDFQSMFAAKVPTWGFACSPLVEGDLVIVQTGGANGSVAAFDRVTGAPRWKSLNDAAGYSSPVATPAAGVPQVVCFTGDGVVGLRQDNGSKLWSFPWKTSYDCNVATPIVAGRYVFISSDYSAGCALLELSPQGSGGVHVEPVWIRRNKLMRNHFSTCVLHQGHLYGFDVTGDGVMGMLKCVDLRTAEEMWSARNLDKGSLLVADGHLLVFTQSGRLALVEAKQDGYVKKADFLVFDESNCWAPPALAGGRLYLRSNREAVCVELRK